MKSNAKGLRNQIILYVILVIIAVVCIAPFWLMIVNATRSNEAINSGISLMPGDMLVQNAQTLVLGRVDGHTGARMQGIDVPRGFFNSLIIAISATALTAYFGTLTAYAFAIYRFKFQKLLFAVILMVIMIPTTVNMIGVYKLTISLGMIDSWWPLILPAIASPFAVFFLRSYLAVALSSGLIEAARIDGAKELTIFHKIGLPLAGPGIATVSIFGFLGVWNSYLLPLIVLNSTSLYTLPMMIQQLNTTTFNRDLGALYFGIAVSIVPILIAFACFSKYLVEGLNVGGIKE